MITHKAFGVVRSGDMPLSNAYIEIRKQLECLSREERLQLLQYIHHYGNFDIIGNLPIAIAKSIFDMFTAKELCQMRIVSKKWNTKIVHDAIWKEKCEEYSMIPANFRAKFTHDSTIPIFYDIFRRSMTMTKTWKTLQCKRYEVRHGNGIILCMLMSHITRLFTGYVDGSIHVFDCLCQEPVTTIQAHTAHVSCLAHRGNLLASGSRDTEIHIFAISNLVHMTTLKGHTSAVTALAFSSFEDSVLFSGSEDGTIRIWDVTAEACLRILHGQENVISSLVYCPKFPENFCQSEREVKIVKRNRAGFLVAGSHARNVFLWDLKTSARYDHAEVISTVMDTNGPVTALTVYDEHDEAADMNASSNEYVYARRRLNLPTFAAFAGELDSTVSIFSLPGLEKTYVESPNVHHNTIWAIAAAPIHSKLVTASGDKTAVVWDFKSHKTCVTLGGFDSAITTCVIPPQEEALCFGTELGTIVIFDLQEFS